MKLHRSRRRALREIERELTVSDPHLAALLRMFTVLAQDDVMPRAERITGGLFRLMSGLRRWIWPRRPGGRRPGPRRAREGWRAVLVTVLYGSLVALVVTSGCLSGRPGTGYPHPGTGYPHRW